MLAETQDSVYFQRMASSLQDKAQLLPHIEGNRVLDVGAGGGELAEVIRLMDKDVWALDGSHAALNRIKENFPEVHPLLGLAHEIAYMVPKEHFSTVVCSSIFHEVYSYGIPETGPYSVDALKITLKALYDSLEVGGVLLIRDGIMPTEWDREVFITFKDSEGPRFWEAYHRHAPFASWAGDGQRCIHLYPTEDELVYRGNLESAMEFLYTYTWGWQSSQREMKELYGLFTQETYIAFLEDLGFTVELAGQYLQPGYYEHLKDKVSLKDAAGNDVPLPSSNFLLKARKN